MKCCQIKGEKWCFIQYWSQDFRQTLPWVDTGWMSFISQHTAKVKRKMARATIHQENKFRILLTLYHIESCRQVHRRTEPEIKWGLIWPECLASTGLCVKLWASEQGRIPGNLDWPHPLSLPINGLWWSQYKAIYCGQYKWSVNDTMYSRI